MIVLHLLQHIGASLFAIAAGIFAAAAFALQKKGWQNDAFECVMWALGCAFVTVLLW